MRIRFIKIQISPSQLRQLGGILNRIGKTVLPVIDMGLTFGPSVVENYKNNASASEYIADILVDARLGVSNLAGAGARC